MKHCMLLADKRASFPVANLLKDACSFQCCYIREFGGQKVNIFFPDAARTRSCQPEYAQAWFGFRPGIHSQCFGGTNLHSRCFSGSLSISPSRFSWGIKVHLPPDLSQCWLLSQILVQQIRAATPQMRVE